MQIFIERLDAKGSRTNCILSGSRWTISSIKFETHCLFCCVYRDTVITSRSRSRSCMEYFTTNFV